MSVSERLPVYEVGRLGRKHPPLRLFAKRGFERINKPVLVSHGCSLAGRSAWDHMLVARGDLCRIHLNCRRMAPSAIAHAAAQRRDVIFSPSTCMASAVPKSTLVSRNAASCAVAPYRQANIAAP